jgi:hypothetical protein
LTVTGDEALLAATGTHKALVMSETLALELELVAGDSAVSVVRL